MTDIGVIQEHFLSKNTRKRNFEIQMLTGIYLKSFPDARSKKTVTLVLYVCCCASGPTAQKGETLYGRGRISSC